MDIRTSGNQEAGYQYIRVSGEAILALVGLSWYSDDLIPTT
jgi:hypothetical protein